MRNNRDKWSFYKSKKPLKQEEVAYWKKILNKILKVGIEFEFNLPEKKNGTCKGENPLCACAKLLEPTSNCWQVCAHEFSNGQCIMETTNASGLCNNKTDTCEPEDCKTCSLFKLKCNGIYCPSFISKCCVCVESVKNCKSCKYLYDPNLDPDNIRKKLMDELRPNNTYGLVSETGVHSITTDGSLLGKKGAEVITIGRRVDYWEFYKMSKQIMDSALSKGAYINERCSMHMHLLASYYSKVVTDGENHSIPPKVNEMERDMPEIIMANLHQLVRRYQNAITWMVMGLDEPNRMTRWEKFRVSVLSISAVLLSMQEVAEEVFRASGENKYGWINYRNVEFSTTGNIRRLHVEMRAADGITSPSAISAIACLYYALMIKAVEISGFGVVEIGDKEWLDHAMEVKKALMNNVKSYQDNDRFSDNSNLYQYHETLIGESLDLVRQLKSILIKLGPAYEVLEKLAEHPIALRRCEGKTLEQIEKELEVVLSEEDKFAIAISEIITLNQVSECSDTEEWTTVVSDVLMQNSVLQKQISDKGGVIKIIDNYIKNKSNDGELIWSNKIGAPILI